MEEIYKGVWVGDDQDYERIKNKENWKCARMCKFGNGGHKDTLDYSTMGAPKGKNYLTVEKKDHLAVNILDLDDPNMIPFECILTAVKYVKRMLDEGYKVLIACNSGRSRGPSTGLMFLRAMGDLPYHFVKAEHIYRTLYPNYSPGMGIRQVMKDHWDEMGDYFNATITG